MFFITTDLIGNQKMDNSTKVSLIIEKMITSDPAWKHEAYKILFTISGNAISDEMELINWIKGIQFTDSELLNRVCEVLEIDVEVYLRIKDRFCRKNKFKRWPQTVLQLAHTQKAISYVNTLSEREIEKEIVESCRIIQGITHEERVPFAFPFTGNGVKRKMLIDIRSRNKFVGYFFDTNGIQQHKGIVLDRIWADAPLAGDIDKSNLPELITKSYQEMFLDGFRKYKHIFSSRHPSKE